MVTILASVFVLGILIIVHEFGHFWMARKMGVGVEIFSIGFGKAIYKRKIGETEFLVSWIPLGGYVKMIGDEEEEAGDEPQKHADPKLAYNNKPIWRRLLIVSAGPIANLLFAVFIFALVHMIGFEIPDTKIKNILENSPAERAGMVEGDRIVEIDEITITKWNELVETISKSPGRELTVKVERGGGTTTYLKITPATEVSKTIFGEKIEVGKVGISPDSIFIRYNPFEAVYLGAKKTWEIIYLTGLVVVKIFQNIVPADTIGGPLMIFKIAGDQAEAGLIPLLMFMGVLSVNLGILNLLPVPVLDGGHLVFLAIEAVKGSPISLKGREIAQQVGMFLLLMLMAFAFYNDITRFLTDS